MKDSLFNDEITDTKLYVKEWNVKNTKFVIRSVMPSLICYIESHVDGQKIVNRNEISNCKQL